MLFLLVENLYSRVVTFCGKPGILNKSDIQKSPSEGRAKAKSWGGGIVRCVLSGNICTLSAIINQIVLSTRAIITVYGNILWK